MPLKYLPYAHQQKAFRRLGERRNTIVATGTGSGKTECFLVPILAECAGRVGERGIKAILIYPMNALASDQAERLAGLIHDNEALRGKVTAGIYVGSKEKAPTGTMGEQHIITDRDAILQNPPAGYDRCLARVWTSHLAEPTSASDSLSFRRFHISVVGRQALDLRLSKHESLQYEQLVSPRRRAGTCRHPRNSASV